jgi:NTE family protein
MKIGLALSGGAVRGMAHIGVVEVLERYGVPIDFVAGTSAGALLGAVYCAGLGVEAIKRLSAEVRWQKLARPILSKRGLFSFDPLQVWLEELLENRAFADMAIPFAAVATDMRTGEAVVLREGPLAPAVRASCSVPGVFAPLEYNGRLLGDGAMVNNLPVSVVREMGADYVIGVDVNETWIKLWEIGKTRVKQRFFQVNNAAADCLITPRLAGYSYVNFLARERLIEAGMRAAEEQLRLPQ